MKMPALPVITADQFTTENLSELATQVWRWMRDHPRLSVIALLLAAKKIKKQLTFPPKNMVLEISLDRIELMESPVQPLLKKLYGTKTCFVHLLNTIEAAEQDSRIKAIILHPGGAMNPSMLDELRCALKSFREKSGKPVICYTNTFGEASFGLFGYWLATACSAIVVPPCASVNVTSLQSAAIFFKKMLDKVGIEAALSQRSGFKTAANLFTQHEMTPEHRQQLESILDDILVKIKADLADRDGTADWGEVLENGPYDSARAADAKLVDEVMYYSDLMQDYLPNLVGVDKDKLKVRSVAAYQAFAKPLYGDGSLWEKVTKPRPKVAVLFAEGQISQGSSKEGYENGGPSIGSDTVCAQLRKLRADKSVKGVVFRVSSPGGSYVASDVIHHELKQLAKKNIPIIVSVGGVAASGGYYLSIPAAKIIATDCSIVGSIGVVNGKMVVKSLLDNVGVTSDLVKRGSNSGYFSALEGFDGKNRDRLEKMTDFIYDDFKSHVAEDRSLTLGDVENLAQGQVYLGKRGLEKKLIDSIGGWREALDAMAEQTGASSRHQMHVQRFPPPLSLQALITMSPPKNRDEADEALIAAAPSAFSVALSFFPSISALSTYFAGNAEGRALHAEHIPNFY
ncbi:Protease 4 [Diplonema papillatum]|nr:Protease 4 [Diplonema papillatum]